jgi:hypothetical protein
MPHVNIALIVLLLFSSRAGARVWTDITGRSIEADMVRVESNSVILKKASGEVRCPTNRLCKTDLDFIRDWQSTNADPAPDSGATPPAGAKEQPAQGAVPAATNTPPAPPKALSIQGTPLIAGGQINTYEFNYSPADLIILRRHKSLETKYKIAIAVPADFDPKKPQRVFICSAPSNNETERRAGDFAAIGMYAKTCIDNGWVCLASDCDLGNEADGDKDLVCSLQVLRKEWPGMNGWDFAVGGFSGGAKACFLPCATLIREKYKVIGVFMAGCNQDFSELLRKQLKAPLAGYKNIRAYLSAGSKDTIAPPSSSAAVKKSLKSNGIHDSRLVIHEGGHSMLKPHFDEALKWFVADRQKDKSATSLRRPSDNANAGAAL